MAPAITRRWRMTLVSPDLFDDVDLGIDLRVVGELNNQRLFTLLGVLWRFERDYV